ncbi:MAG: hypothetical protein Ta2E_10890 [Mycoplasmoidaceae bacterium]|nr:MAG: hypothetical protein Ta2E_10890 [Mycoplasmoidaceae bacterium]
MFIFDVSIFGVFLFDVFIFDMFNFDVFIFDVFIFDAFIFDVFIFDVIIFMSEDVHVYDRVIFREKKPINMRAMRRKFITSKGVNFAAEELGENIEARDMKWTDAFIKEGMWIWRKKEEGDDNEGV